MVRIKSSQRDCVSRNAASVKEIDFLFNLLSSLVFLSSLSCFVSAFVSEISLDDRYGGERNALCRGAEATGDFTVETSSDVI